MKRILIIGGVILAIIGLVIFNKTISRKRNINSFVEVKNGLFEITVINSGELIAENSIEVKGPEIVMGSMGGGGHGMHGMDFKILDIVPEGTLVKEGDYIAQLDRSDYSNTLKDEIEKLKTYQEAVDMKILDTAVVLRVREMKLKPSDMLWRKLKLHLLSQNMNPRQLFTRRKIISIKLKEPSNRK